MHEAAFTRVPGVLIWCAKYGDEPDQFFKFNVWNLGSTPGVI